MDQDRARQLLMGLIDGELTTDETRDIHEQLSRSESLRDEYELIQAANGVLELLSETRIDEKLLRHVWKSPFRRVMRAVSYGMIAVGFFALFAMGLEQYFNHGEQHLLLSVSVGGVLLGVILLLLQVIRDRMIVYKTDPYRDIEK